MEKKYNALRIIATGMKVLGVIVAILTVISVCGLLGAGVSLGSKIDEVIETLGEGPNAWGSILGLVGSILASILPVIVGSSIAIMLIAGGEAIYVQLDIEENTRAVEYNTHNIETNTRLFIEYINHLDQLPPSTPIPIPIPTPMPSPQTNTETQDSTLHSISPIIPQNNQDTQYTISTSNKMPIAYCPQCGTKVDSSERFCPKCCYDLSLIL